MTWEEAVSQLRELAKESEDFTTRIQTLASQIQRMCRDAEIHTRTLETELKSRDVDAEWTGN